MITGYQIKLLDKAVQMAGDWRGSIVGNPDPEPLAEFDAFISECRRAVAQVRHDYRTARAAASAKAPRRALQRVSAK